MRNFWKYGLFALSLFAGAAPELALANPMITNGSFETPSYVNQTTDWAYLNGTITGGWNFTEPSSGGNSGIAAYGSTWATATPVPGGGQQVGFFQGGQMSQALTGFAPDTNYSISFWAESRPGYTSTDPLTIWLGSINLGTYTAPSNTSFTYFSTPYYTTGGIAPTSLTLTMVAQSLQSSGTTVDKAIAIDMVSIDVDKPMACSIFLLGIAVLFGLKMAQRTGSDNYGLS